MGSIEPPPVNAPLPAAAAETALTNAPLPVVADALLQWIFTEVGGVREETVMLTDFYPTSSPVRVGDACVRLEDRKYIKVDWDSGTKLFNQHMEMVSTHYRLFPDGRIPPPPLPNFNTYSPEIRLTAKGIARAEKSYRRWTDPVFRNRATRDHLLAWLYNQTGRQPMISITKFFVNPKSIVEGYFLSLEDTEEAAVYLLRNGLVKAAEDNHHGGSYVLQITPNGIDCMEQGGNVVEYLTPRKDRAKYIVGPISGGSVAVGDNTTQNTTINGTDADSLRTLMDAIAHVLPSLRMEMQDQKEAAEAADQIVTETGHRTPDRRNIHAALGRLRDLLARAGNQAFIAAVDYELAKLGLPPAR